VKALKYYGPGNIRVEEVPKPEAKAGEALLAVEACGICATDIKTFVRGHPKIQPGSGLGHEISGVVVNAPGSNQWQEGTRVVVAPYVPCGSCAQCRRGRYSLCSRLFEEVLDPGGFSEFVRVPHRLVSQGMIAVPESLNPDAICFAEPVACCLHAFSSINVQPGESLFITGDGVMGLLQAKLGRWIGAEPVILSGIMPERLKLAADVASVVIDARREDVVSTVRRATEGEGVDKVIVSVADVNAAQTALAAVRKGGAINLFAGMPAGSSLAVEMNRIHYDEVLLTGSFGFGPDDFRKAVQLIATRKIDVMSLVTGSVPLEGVLGAMDRLVHQQALKIIVHSADREVPVP
jgi:L-iditol 2-dehydrogenase